MDGKVFIIFDASEQMIFSEISCEHSCFMSSLINHIKLVNGSFHCVTDHEIWLSKFNISFA